MAAGIHEPSHTSSPAFLENRLKSAGWCPSEVANTQRLGPSALYVATNIHRPADGKDHTSCNRIKCKAYDINEETYQTKHNVDGLCSCPFLGPPLKDVLNILLNTDSIPLIS